MAPLEEKFENDATFQSLLSSQRELLSKLNREKKLEQTQQLQNSATFATNQAIMFPTYKSDNVLLSKRMSIGIGNDSFVLPDASLDPSLYADSCFESYYDGKKRSADENSEISKASKRRRPTLSFLDYIFDKSEEQHFERPKAEKRRVEYNDSDDEDYGVIVEDVSDDEEEHDVGPKMPPEEAKRILVLFESAMGHSQDSQQQIHDWDRKMGLKRSHSKTMRLSSRSRKQLRQFTQQDIMQISSKIPHEL